MASILARKTQRMGRVLKSVVGFRSFIHIHSYGQFWVRNFSTEQTKSNNQDNVKSTEQTVGLKLDGKRVSKEIYNEIKAETLKLKKEYNEVPGLAVLQVGGRPDSTKYVQMKRNVMKDLGFVDFGHNLPEQITQDALLNMIDHLNHNPKVHGILVQLPLPYHIDANVITRCIRPRKDVDGFHPNNVGVMTLKTATQSIYTPLHANQAHISNYGIQPCTPKGCIELLDRYGIEINGSHAVVLGRSNIVGHPLGTLLLHRNATVTICHSKTKNIPEICKQADIVVAAIGIPRFVKKDWIKPGAAVLDVGVNFAPDPSRGNKTYMCGDVDYVEVKEVAGAITPVPGGIGPMTVAMLMRNTLDNTERYLQKYYRPPWFMSV